MRKKAAFLFPALALVFALAMESSGEVPWHPYPPDSEIKSLPQPRDPRKFIFLTYRRILGREPLPVELGRWLNELQQPGMKRDRMILELQDGDEYFIRQAFLTILRRPPLPGELRERLAFLTGGGKRRDVIRNLIYSEEYRRSVKSPR